MIETVLTSLAVLLRILSNPLGNVFQKQLTAAGNHPLLVNCLTYVFLSVGCLFIAFILPWPALPSSFWIYSILAGITGAVGNGFLVKALQKGDLSILGPINSYKSIVGIIVGIFLLGEIPNLWGLLGIALIVFVKRGRDIPIPFGPYLAAAGLIALVYGKDITQAYLGFPL